MAQTVTRRDFPHAPHVARGHETARPANGGGAHVSLGDGCYSCHSFTASDAPFRAMPRLGHHPARRRNGWGSWTGSPAHATCGS